MNHRRTVVTAYPADPTGTLEIQPRPTNSRPVPRGLHRFPTTVGKRPPRSLAPHPVHAWRRGRRRHSSMGRSTKPVLSFGVKKVDLGGISSPSRAVRSISATWTGRISTPAVAAPDSTAARVSSSPC